MKSIFFPFLTLIFLLGTAHAQQIQAPSKEQLRQQFATMFQQAELSLQDTAALHTSATVPPSQSAHSSTWQQRVEREIFYQLPPSKSTLSKLEGKPWQMALFLAAPDRPMDETLGTLRWSIRHGYIKQAAVLDLSPAQKNRDFQFYLLYANGKNAKTQTMTFSADTDTQLLLEELTKHLQKYKDSLQTGIIIDAHGSTQDIYFDRNSHDGDTFSLQMLMDAAQEFDLHIDVMQLIACHVGTIANVQLLAENNRVDYTVISSDFAYGNSEQFYYSLLWYACYPPLKAARLASTWHIRMHGPWEATSDATNAMALDLRTLNNELEEWIGAYFNLCSSQGQNQDLGEELQSFRLFAQKQVESAKTGDIAAVCGKDYGYSEDERITFIKSGERLLDKLSQSILAQWCQPPGQERFIRHHLRENGCTDGPSVDNDSWQQLWNSWQDKHLPYFYY